jgi:hypothetical protein
MRTWISDRAEKTSVEFAYNAEDVVVNEFAMGFVVCTAPRNMLEFDVECSESRYQCLQDFQCGGDHFNADSVSRDRCNVVRFLFVGHDGCRLNDRRLTDSLQ